MAVYAFILRVVGWRAGRYTLAILSLTTSVAAAQSSPPLRDSISLAPGDRVRLRQTGDGARPITAQLLALRGDSLVVSAAGGDSVTLARGDLESLEAERGGQTRNLVVTVGTMIGLVTGGVVAVIHCANDRADCAAENQAIQRAAYYDRPYISSVVLLGALAEWPARCSVTRHHRKRIGMRSRFPCGRRR